MKHSHSTLVEFYNWMMTHDDSIAFKAKTAEEVVVAFEKEILRKKKEEEALNLKNRELDFWGFPVGYDPKFQTRGKVEEWVEPENTTIERKTPAELKALIVKKEAKRKQLNEKLTKLQNLAIELRDPKFQLKSMSVLTEIGEMYREISDLKTRLKATKKSS